MKRLFCEQNKIRLNTLRGNRCSTDVVCVEENYKINNFQVADKFRNGDNESLANDVSVLSKS